MFLACNLSQTFFDSVGVSLPQGSASLQLSSKQNEDGIAKVMVGEKVPISPKHQAQNNGNSFKYSSFYSNEVNTFMWSTFLALAELVFSSVWMFR